MKGGTPVQVRKMRLLRHKHGITRPELGRSLRDDLARHGASLFEPVEAGYEL